MRRGTCKALRMFGMALGGAGLLAGVSAVHASGEQAGGGGYTIVNLGTLGGNLSEAYTISENGYIGGTVHRAISPTKTAFIYTGGVMTDLNVIGDTNDVNDFGEGVGRMIVGPCCGTTHAFAFDGMQVADLGTLGGSYSEAYAINSAGDTVGYSQTADFRYHAFLFTNGTMVDLGTPGGDYSFAYDINDSGVIVGGGSTTDGDEHAFVYDGGTFTTLVPPGATYSYAFAVNNWGQVTGAFDHHDNGQHAFLYDSGAFTVLAYPGSLSTNPYGMNNRGDVVGYYQNPDFAFRPFLYSDGVIQDLNDFLPEGSGWVLKEAWDINDAGVIVGNGFFNGEIRAFMLTPVGATPTGTDVVVSTTVPLPGGGDATASIQFSSVVEGGATIVTASEVGPPLPSGFRLPEGSLYLDVETTAAFSGTATLCFSWVEGALANEANARLLHFEGGQWADVTTSVDPLANVICGAVTSLSPFVIAELTYEFLGFAPPLIQDGSASIQQNKAGRTIPVKFQLRFGGQLTGAAAASIAVYRILNVATGMVDTTDLTEDSGAAGDSGTWFRFDAAAQQYVFNLSTTGWVAPATYRIVVTLSDGSTHAVDFSLR